MTVRIPGRRHGSAVLLLAALLLLVGLTLLAAARPAVADDSTAPELLAFSMTPKHVDTETADQTVTVILTARDTQTGVGSVTWSLFMPGSAQPNRSVGLVRTSGDLFTGTYTGQIVLPRGSQGGAWVADLGISDGVGNVALLRAGDIASLFGSGSESITNDAAAYDAQAPRITDFHISPKRVNTASEGQTLTVTLTVTDNLAGVDDILVTLRSFVTPQQEIRFYPHRVSGDALHGVYSATAIMPKDSQGGGWGALTSATDHAANTTMLWLQDMRDLFGAANVEVSNEAAVWDDAMPRIIAYRVTPAQIDASPGPQTLDVSFTVADDGSGIGYVDGFLQPLTGFQEAQFSVHRVSGDDYRAVYEGTATIPQHAKEGIWRPTFSASDKLGNSGFIRPEDLDAALPGAEGLYVINTAVAEQVTIDRGWTLRGGGNSVTFCPGTVVTRRDAGSFAFYKMVATPFTIDDTVPTTDLDGKPVATLRFGIPGLNLSFSKEVEVGLAVGSRYDGYRMHVQSLVEDGDAWADESSADVVDGHLFFAVTHATRFAACLSRPRLSRLQPFTARRGSKLTLTGRGFGKRRGTVRIGGRTCRKVLLWTSDRVVCKVPANAPRGKVRVTVATRRAGASNPRSLRILR